MHASHIHLCSSNAEGPNLKLGLDAFNGRLRFTYPCTLVLCLWSLGQLLSYKDNNLF
jgi:hypothetical protein